jgi:catechol 2,3-dioxygenase-like lactoylglutathione lyase family enzyme
MQGRTCAIFDGVASRSWRENAMAVRALLHYALEVPDLRVGEKFYRNFGLADKPTQDEAIHLRPAQLTRESVLLYPGPKKRLHHLAFGAPPADYAQVREAIQRAGVREVDPPTGSLDGGIWIRDPDGNLINVSDEGPLTPPADPPLALNSPGHPGRQAVRGCPEADLIAQPRRLGHVLLFTPDVDRQLAFYTQVLGLKLSDRCRHIIAFLRCSTDHHNVAFLSSKGPGFHHGSFEVGGVDEIAMGAQRMRESGWEPGWGLGRHVIGSNYFYYIRDPWGSFAEYFFDLDHIPESCAWEPRDFPEQDALYRWGPEPPQDFGENKELG